MAAMKKHVYRHAASDLDTAKAESNRLMRASLQQPDFEEGVAWFPEKRAPLFASFEGGWATDW